MRGEGLFFRLYFIISYLGFVYFFISLPPGRAPLGALEFLILLGLPPRGFFFIKVFIISEFGASPLFLLGLIIIIGGLLFAYLNLFELFS